MSESTTKQKKTLWSYLYGLTCGPDGVPDEFRLAFIVSEIVTFGGFIANAFMDKHFDGATFVAAQSGLLSAYRLSIAIGNRLGTPGAPPQV